MGSMGSMGSMDSMERSKGIVVQWRRSAGLGLGVAVTLATLSSTAPVSAAGASSPSGELPQAHKALLVLSDMPAGWTTKKSSNPNSNVGDAQLARCIGVATSLIAENPPSVSSPQFQDRSGSLTVNDQVSIFPSAKNAADELAAVANPKTPGCMTQLASGPLKSKLFGKTPAGVKLGTVLVSPTDRAAFPGTAGYSVSVPISGHGVTVNVTATELFAIKGRLGHQITFSSTGEPFSIGLEQHLAAVAVSRL
jgi:hypothetical protein